MVVIIKKEKIVESWILMMKSIDSVYDLICVLSNAGSFDQGETIKVGRIILGQSRTYQKFGCHIEGSVDILTEGFGPRRAKIMLRKSELWRSTE